MKSVTKGKIWMRKTFIESMDQIICPSQKIYQNWNKILPVNFEVKIKGFKVSFDKREDLHPKIIYNHLTELEILSSTKLPILNFSYRHKPCKSHHKLSQEINFKSLVYFPFLPPLQPRASTIILFLCINSDV